MKPNLKEIALMRANGQSSKKIGDYYSITPEHVRQYYFSQLNQKSIEEMEEILK